MFTLVTGMPSLVTETPLLAAASARVPHTALVAVAVAAVVGSALVLVALWRSRRPHRPATGPVTSDLGDESPAIVDLVTGGVVVDDDAVPATVVDLAARRWVGIEEVHGGHVVLRLRHREGEGGLTRYEQRVLDHIESKAVDRIAPAATLTLGPEGASRRWWKGFVREVNAHAGELGPAVRGWGGARWARGGHRADAGLPHRRAPSWVPSWSPASGPSASPAHSRRGSRAAARRPIELRAHPAAGGRRSVRPA